MSWVTEGESTLLDQVVGILTDPDEPLLTRDGFFCNYKSSKQKPDHVFAALVCFITLIIS
jgi:hypothetical protein